MKATHRGTGFYVKITKNMSNEPMLFFGFSGGQHDALEPKHYSQFASWLRTTAGQIEAEVRKQARDK